MKSNGSSNEQATINWERLARAGTKELRVSILEILSLDGGRALSPTDMTAELQAHLSNINYHVRELEKIGLVKITRERSVRGATEHFYRMVP